MKNSRIQWTDHTFNPWRGCTKVSAGCANCYAEQQAKRNPAVLGEWGDGGQRVVAAESYWDLPVRWDMEAQLAFTRKRVFCASLGDVFEDRPGLIEPRRRLFDLVYVTPFLDWLLLTKRPENAARLVPERFLRMVGLGVSVEDQAAADARIPVLLQTPAALRFVSCEPLLGPVDLGRNLPWAHEFECSCYEVIGGHQQGCMFYGHTHAEINSAMLRAEKGLDWVIVGGESGQRARPCDLSWIRAIRDQCKAAQVPCFVKQLGARPIAGAEPLPVAQSVESMMAHGEYDPDPLEYRFRDRKGGDPDEWPEDLRVREFPGRPS